MPDSKISRRMFFFLATAVGLLALLLRENYLLLAQPVSPINGDIRQYVAYALNLAQHGIFSSALPGSEAIIPDAFRGPGYPLFLAACMRIAGATTDAWYVLAVHLQAVLGTATVVMGIALGRYWLSRSMVLCSGLLMAVWPHHVTATGVLLSEVVFGFVLMLAILLTAHAQRSARPGIALAAGMAFGYAYLINPIVLLFPPVVALIFWKTGYARKGAVILAVSLVFAGAWAARNATLPPDHTPGRAAINLVQGSWPLYQAAWVERLNDPVAQQIMADIGAEEKLVSSDPARGLATIARRFGDEPTAYLHWYLIEKPYLLWDWDIRIGADDIYFLKTNNSPFETHRLLHGIKAACRQLIRPIFLLALIGVVVPLFRLLTRRPVQMSAVLVATFFVYVTVIHDIFQAEPRYSIPYRPFELLLAGSAVSLAWAWLAERIRRRAQVTPSLH